jgi:hypothetical protein
MMCCQAEWQHTFHLPSCLYQLPNLQHLQLQLNSTAAWPHPSTGFTSLTRLVLHNATGAMQQQGLPVLPNLQELHLAGFELHRMQIGPLLCGAAQQLTLLSLEFAEVGAFAAEGGLADVLLGAVSNNEEDVDDSRDDLRSNIQQDYGNQGEAVNDEQQISSSAQEGPARVLQQQQMRLMTRWLSALRVLRIAAPCTGLPASQQQHSSSRLSDLSFEARQARQEAAAVAGPAATNIQQQQQQQQQDLASLHLCQLFSCLQGLTSMQIALQHGACAAAQQSNVHAAHHNACQPLFAALACLPQLVQLQLSGLPELPTAAAAECGAAAAAAAILANLLRLGDLDLQDCGGSSSSSRDSSSDSAGAQSPAAAAELALPSSLTRLRWVRCCAGRMPVQQLASGLPQLRMLLLDRQAAQKAGQGLLQQLAGRGCKVVTAEAR